MIPTFNVTKDYVSRLGRVIDVPVELELVGSGALGYYISLLPKDLRSDFEARLRETDDLDFQTDFETLKKVSLELGEVINVFHKRNNPYHVINSKIDGLSIEVFKEYFKNKESVQFGQFGNVFLSIVDIDDLYDMKMLAYFEGKSKQEHDLRLINELLETDYFKTK